MKALLGTKLQMSQLFAEDGAVVPVTIVQSAPNVVTQVKAADKDGYAAVQIGFGKRKNLTKALAGHLAKTQPVRWLKEFRVEDSSAYQLGQTLDVSQFAEGDTVKVTGWSKGRGFQGVVKRHHFKGGPASHGHKDNLRMPGSIGATFPQHVVKGTRMAGRMAVHPVTQRNMTVVKVDAEAQQIYIKGALPGPHKSLIMIQTQ